MKDFGKSDNPAVQAQLDRLAALSLPQGRLGLDTIRALMERLGNPHRALPPVFHVAGTNGKGSTCAFLRAMLEAEGYKVHVTTSPHLVRYNERIRLAGELISDAELAAVLEEVLDAGADFGPSFFEVTIAAAFLAFSRTPADACVVEVGMGGRFDATNVLEPEVLAACGIAALGLDHERFLLAPEEGVPQEPMARIAFEKAGIAKRGVPLVALESGSLADDQIAKSAEAAGAHLRAYRGSWYASPDGGHYEDHFGLWNGLSQKWGLDHFELFLPEPTLKGDYQRLNAALAVALLRAQTRVMISEAAIYEGIRAARWPARMQRLAPGPLMTLVPEQTVWLDGGHNPSAGKAIAAHFTEPLHLIIGMIEGKDPRAIIDALGDRVRTVTVVPVPGHESHPVEAFGPSARPAPDVLSAMAMIPDDGLPILIAGSLYLAGEVLRLNRELPD